MSISRKHGALRAGHRRILLAAVIAQMLAAPAFAAPVSGTEASGAEASADGAATLDTVVVTGSRLSGRTVKTSEAPIDIITGEEIERASKTDLLEALQVLVPSLTLPSQPSNGLGFPRGPRRLPAWSQSRPHAGAGQRQAAPRHRQRGRGWFGSGATGGPGPDSCVGDRAGGGAARRCIRHLRLRRDRRRRQHHHPQGRRGRRRGAPCRPVLRWRGRQCLGAGRFRLPRRRGGSPVRHAAVRPARPYLPRRAGAGRHAVLLSAQCRRQAGAAAGQPVQSAPARRGHARSARGHARSQAAADQWTDAVSPARGHHRRRTSARRFDRGLRPADARTPRRGVVQRLPPAAAQRERARHLSGRLFADQRPERARLRTAGRGEGPR